MQRMLLMLVGLVCAGYTYASKILAENETNIAYAIWCKAESTLIFLQSDTEIQEENTYQGHVVTKVWKDDEVINTGENEPGWRPVVMGSLVKVIFDETFKAATPTSTYQWFWQCKSLETIEGIKNLNTSEVTTMRAMFSECANLKNLDVRGFNTSKVRVMRFMFANCFSLTRLDVKSFDTKNVEDMQGMFYGCSGLKEIDLKNFVTGNVTNMSDMFRGCSNLTFLDLYSFNTARVTDMTRMFYECSKLTGIDVSGFDTSNVREMPWIFYGCKSLTQLDVSNFNTEKVVNMRTAFGNCHELRLLDLNNWNTINVENMRSMFYNCVRLSTLKLDNFNTEKVKNMALMFLYCTSLDILDLSKFDTHSVETADSMFFNDHELRSVIVGDGWKISRRASSTNMFFECIKIVGENGTTYNSKHVDRTYARIDREGYPGYFRISALTVKPILTLTCSEGGWMEFMGEEVSGYTKSFVIDRGADVKVDYGARRGYEIDGGPSFTVTTGTSFSYNSHQCSVEGMTKDVAISITFQRNSEPISQFITFDDNTMKTFCSTETLDFSDVDGLNAYIASGFSATTGDVIMSKVEKVPAGTGLLIVGCPDSTYEVPFTETDFVYSNLLVGVMEDTNITSGYVLEGDQFTSVTGSATVNAGEAYLRIPSEGGSSRLNIKFTDAISGVDELKMGAADETGWYSLQGSRLAGKPAQPGIYLHQGKKVLVK